MPRRTFRRVERQVSRSASDVGDFFSDIGDTLGEFGDWLDMDPMKGVEEEQKKAHRQAEQDARDREAQEAQAQEEARRRREAMSRRALADRPDLFSLLGGPQRQRLG